jgi:hypothetical protein
LGRAEVDANTTGDTEIALLVNKYRITKITAYDASVNLDTVLGGIYTAGSKGGSAIVAASQAYTALTAPAKYLDITLASPATTDYLTATSLFFSPTTPQGAAATVRIDVWGDVLEA